MMAKIKIKIDGDDKEVSVGEAKRIYNELKEIFDNDNVQTIPYTPWEYPSNPISPDMYPKPYRDVWYCSVNKI